MQTFLPYPSFTSSANVLDKKRCFKQVVEAKQIICILQANNLPKDWISSKSYIKQRWKNHPAVKMWKGHEELLKLYYNTFLRISLNKYGINTTMPFLDVDYQNLSYPWWLGNYKFHRAMRARLIQKNPQIYSGLFPFDNNYNDGRYLWPLMESKEFYMV